MNTRPHVTDVVANLKTPLRATLGPKTLILGPNGSGKSTITDAVRLALLGEIDDVASKRRTSDTDIAAHVSPDGTGDAAAEVTLSDGRHAYWRRADGKTQAQHLDDAAMLADAVGDLGARNNDTIRQWLTREIQRRASPAWSQAAWEDVPSTVHKVIAQAAGHQQDTDGALTDRADFDVLLDAVKKQIRTDQAALRDAKAALTNLGATGVYDADRVAAIDAELATLTDTMDAVDPELHANAQQVKDYYEAALPGLQEALAQAEADRTAAQGELERAQATDPTRKLRALRDFVAEANPNADVCIVCGTPNDAPGSNVNLAERYPRLLADLDAYIQNAETDSPVRRAQADVQTQDARVAEAQQAVQRAQGELARAGEVLTRPVASPDIGNRRAVLQTERDGLVQAKALGDRAAQARKQRDAAEEREALGKRAKTALERARDRYLEIGVQDFSDHVSRYLPDQAVFHVVFDGPHVRLGVAYAGGRPITALSGSQQATLLAALACATAPDDGLAIMVMPDRQWDPDHLRAAMHALEDTDVQVIIPSTVKPKGRVRKVWTVIDLEAEDGVTLGEPEPGGESDDAEDDKTTDAADADSAQDSAEDNIVPFGSPAEA